MGNMRGSGRGNRADFWHLSKRRVLARQCLQYVNHETGSLCSMVSIRLCSLVVALTHGICSSPVQAGPWPRDVGQVFIANEVALDRIEGAARAAHRHYLEYGLTRRVTLGAKLEQQTAWLPGVVWQLAQGFASAPWRGRIFLRWHPGEVVAQTPYALEVQLGHNPTRQADRLRIAAYIGHGFDLVGHEAWARFDLSAGIAGALRDGQRDATLQLGLSLTDTTRAWLDLGATFLDDDRTDRVTVSTALDMTALHSITVGVTRTFGTWSEMGLRLGLWSQF